MLPMALAYGRYLLCEQRGAADSCGECGPGKMVDKLAHPDLHLIFPIFLAEKSKTCEPVVTEWRAAVLKEPYLDEEMWRAELEGENKQLRMGVDIAAEINSPTPTDVQIVAKNAMPASSFAWISGRN